MATLLIPINYFINGDVVDANTDLDKIELPNPAQIEIKKVTINSLLPALGTTTIDIRNTSAGGGDGITVTFSVGEYYAESTGTLSLTTYAWIRSVAPDGLGDLNVSLWYRYTA